MSAISDIREKEFSTWTPEQNCFVEIWETNGLEDLAEKAATNYAAMQARIDTLEKLLLKCKDSVEYTAEFDKEDMQTYQEIIKALK